MGTEASEAIAVKYASVIFHIPFPFPEISKSFWFDRSTELKTGSIKEQIEGPDSKHWSNWLGSLAWESLCESQYILSTWTPTATAEVLNEENKQLQEKVATIFRLLPLVGALRPPSEDVFLISGKGTLSNNELTIQDVREFTHLSSWRGTFYCQSSLDDYFKWAETELCDIKFLDLWKDRNAHYTQLFILVKNNRQLFESYRSFQEAMSGTQLEFKIPNLVRALECIVDCWGHEEFAKRVLFLTGVPDSNLPFSIAANTEELLKDIYQLRNDCSHGKPFGYSLEKKLGKSPDDALVAKYEFLIEWAARKVLNVSFTNPSLLKCTSDRDALVAAWKQGLIVP